MKKYEENIKKYEENMKKYEEIMKIYEENMKKLLSPYIGRGTWKNFKLVPRAWGGPHKTSLGGEEAREKT